MRLFDPFFSLSATKIVFYQKSKSKFIFDQKHRARFFSCTISCLFFYRARFFSWFRTLVQTTESGRSWAKVDGPKDSKWTVCDCGRSWNPKVDGLKWNGCTIWSIESGRSQGIKVDGQKVWNWTVLKNQCGRSRGQKMDGLKGWNWTVILERSLWWNWGSGDIRVRIQLGLE